MNTKTIFTKTLGVILLLNILFSGVIYAQQITIKMSSAPIKEILAEITRQTGYNFIYSSVLTDLDKKTSVNYSSPDKKISPILEQIFKGTAIVYTIKGNQVVLQNKELKQGTSNGNVTISGEIKDDAGIPLAGAYIYLKSNNKTGATANNDGKFSFQVPSTSLNTDLLLCSFIGMQSIELPIDGRGAYNISMAYASESLSDVVVTGYQTLDKGRATGSYEIVSQKQMGIVTSGSITDKLEGIVPGLLVDNKGNMLLRGQATIYASSKPLIVVDGFPMEYDMSTINPNDVEQISVLKDAASASIWGVRAANGVIVITTKRGAKNQKTQVSYNGNIKVGSKFDLESLGLIGSRGYINWEHEGFVNAGIGTVRPFLDAFTPAAVFYDQFKKGEISESQLMKEYDKLGEYNHTGDLKKYFYQNPLVQLHTVSIAGGGENVSNYASIYYENSLGDLIGNSSNKFGFQYNSGINLAKWAKLSLGVRGNYGNRKLYTQTPYVMRVPYYRIVDDNGNSVNERSDIMEYMKDDFRSKGFINWDYDRLKDRDDIKNTIKEYNISANLKLDITLPLGFTFSTSGMYTVANNVHDLLYTQESYYVRNLYNRFSYYNESTNVLTKNLPMGGILLKTDTGSDSFTFRNILGFDKSFGKFAVSAQAGCEMFAMRTKEDYDSYLGYDPQALIFDSSLNLYDLRNEGVVGFTGSKVKLDYREMIPYKQDVEDRFFSMFGTANINYAGKYTFFGSLRYDQTNLYGRSSQYRDQPTWSVGAKWDINKENFFKSKTINNLSLKASYGLSGNIDKSTSPYMIASNTIDYYTGLKMLRVENPENKNLCWEKVYTLNIGAEMGMFNNRLNFSADFYNRSTKDALGSSIYDPTSGWSNLKANTASLVNRGIDFSVNAIPVITNDFSWNTTFTLSYNYNSVTKVNSGDATINTIRNGDAIQGKPVDYIYTYKYGGVNDKGEPTVYNRDNELLEWGAVSAFGLEDLLFPGRKTAPIFGSWSNIVQYKGFELDLLFTYKMGHKVGMPAVEFSGMGELAIGENRWNKPGDEAKTWIPKRYWGAFSMDRMDLINSSDLRLEKGNIIRLRSIGLGYDFKRLIKNNNVFSGLSLKFSVENPWYWVSNSENLDVENLILEGERSNSTYYGNQQTYCIMNLKLTF